MKYTLSLDENNYVMGIAHTKNDDFELDISTIEVQYLNAYQKVKDKLVLDENRKQELIEQEHQHEIQEEIITLQANLNSTDYIMARMLEEIMSLDKPITFISDMIKIFVEYGSKYKDTLADRKAWRERIEELRNGK